LETDYNFSYWAIQQKIFSKRKSEETQFESEIYFICQVFFSNLIHRKFMLAFKEKIQIQKLKFSLYFKYFLKRKDGNISQNQ
jgi:hypothetical protein